MAAGGRDRIAQGVFDSSAIRILSHSPAIPKFSLIHSPKAMLKTESARFFDLEYQGRLKL
jgi:hypothetical protein